MIIEILTPEGQVFAGEAMGVQLPGTGGLFEVLDKHAPLVSALNAGNVKVLLNKTDTESYSIKGGFVEVFNNKSTVLVEGATKL
jgi:F-type H+-transporting ATPase subunit epsilon